MSEQMGWTKVQKENGDWAFAGGVDNLLLVGGPARARGAEACENASWGAKCDAARAGEGGVALLPRVWGPGLQGWVWRRRPVRPVTPNP